MDTAERVGALVFALVALAIIIGSFFTPALADLALWPNPLDMAPWTW